jgi:hypothetical protein
LFEIRTQPDSIRTNKSLYKKIVEDSSPDIPFAIKDSTKYLEIVLTSPEVVVELQGVINTEEGRNLLGSDFIYFVLKEIQPSQVQNESLKSLLISKVKRNTPRFIKAFYKKIMISSLR